MFGAFIMAAAVDLNQLALYGIGLVVVVAILGTGIQAYLASSAQQNLNNMNAQALQAITGQSAVDNLADELQETGDDGEGN